MKAFFSLIAAAWRYAEGRRIALVTYVLMFLTANVIWLFEPIVIGRVLNNIQQAASLPDPLRAMMMNFGLMVLLSAGFWAFHGPARVMENSVAFHIRVHFVDHLYRIITGLPIQWQKNHHSGQTINRFRKAESALYNFSHDGFQFIEMAVRLAGSVLALTFIFPFAAMLALTVSAFALTIVFIIDKYLVSAYDAINEKEHHTATALHDYVTNIITVITLRLQRLTQGEVWRRMTHYFPMFRRTNVVNETKWFLTTMVISLMTVSVLAWYAYSTITAGEVLLAGTFFMLYDYLQKIGGAFYTFAWKYSATVEQYANFLAAREILAAEIKMPEQEAGLPRDWKRIDVGDLHFRYGDEEQQRRHLDGVSLLLERGKRIALVGESGSGKSTLMSLIRGLQRPDTVTVRCDGAVLPHGLRHLANHTTLIPQEPEIFANTIEYNITVDTEQPREELMEDVRIASFDGVLAKLPRGLQTHINEKGVNLSGGEKQRLALARGIFAAKHSDIVLLDEPTSSVDSENERKIYKALFEHFADRCVISSIHKLHLLPMFDRIYVLDQGRLVEEGAFDDLIRTQGILARLWRQYNEDRENDPQHVGEIAGPAISRGETPEVPSSSEQSRERVPDGTPPPY